MIKNILRPIVKRFPFATRAIMSLFPNNDLVAKHLNKTFRRINFIDIGCERGGDFKALYQRMLPTKHIFSVGIDPIHYKHYVPYSVFLKTAISDRKDGKYDFNIYKDPQCNSLEKMKTENVTHNPNDKRKFFAEGEIENLVAVEKTWSLRLSSVIELLGLEDEILHFIKIDAQGSDLEVFRSLGKYIKNVLFVQVESVMKIALYENQPLFEEERREFKKHGFRVFRIQDHGSDGLERDSTYINEMPFRQNKT